MILKFAKQKIMKQNSQMSLTENGQIAQIKNTGTPQVGARQKRRKAATYFKIPESNKFSFKRFLSSS